MLRCSPEPSSVRSNLLPSDEIDRPQAGDKLCDLSEGQRRQRRDRVNHDDHRGCRKAAQGPVFRWRGQSGEIHGVISSTRRSGM
jgi:hypothetical protein